VFVDDSVKAMELPEAPCAVAVTMTVAPFLKALAVRRDRR
jgi:hypothetical protein